MDARRPSPSATRMYDASDEISSCVGDRHRLQVSQLSDKDDVRILAQRCPQRHLKAICMNANFALIDKTLLVMVDELDWVFDCEDMIGPIAVDMVDQCR